MDSVVDRLPVRRKFCCAKRLVCGLRDVDSADDSLLLGVFGGVFCGQFAAYGSGLSFCACGAYSINGEALLQPNEAW